MKIAIIVQRLSTRGGTERFAHGFARWACSEGHEVDVWCASVEDPIAQVKVCHLRAGGRGRMWRMAARVQAVKAVPVDAYDSVLNLMRGPVDGVYRAGGGCHRAWVEDCGWTLADAMAVRVDRSTVDRARTVIANSQMASRELQQWYGVPSDRLRVVHNGVDLERFRPDAHCTLPGDGPAIVFFGSGFHRKGLLTALRATACMAEIRLVIIGSDKRSIAYERMARQLNIADRVSFLGSIAEPERLLPAAKAMILPTRYDPFANACLEAMACGVPVVTTHSNGAAEVLPETWMALDRDADIQRWVDVLKRVLDEPSLREACRAAAENHPAQATFAAVAAVMEQAIT